MTRIMLVWCLLWQGESSDEQPVSIKSCIVDIAHDYTKRKNVFRMTTFNGSEFLFQVGAHQLTLIMTLILPTFNKENILILWRELIANKLDLPFI